MLTYDMLGPAVRYKRTFQTLISLLVILAAPTLSDATYNEKVIKGRVEGIASSQSKSRQYIGQVPLLEQVETDAAQVEEVTPTPATRPPSATTQTPRATETTRVYRHRVHTKTPLPPPEKHVSRLVAVVRPTGVAYSCTGVLLSPFWVMTSAQCFFKDFKLTENHTSVAVYTSVENAFRLTALSSHHESIRLVIHPHFGYAATASGQFGFYVNNLALIQVKNPFRSSTVYLPIASQPWSDDYRGRRVCDVYGFSTFSFEHYDPLELSFKYKRIVITKPCPCIFLLRDAYGNSSNDWACVQSQMADCGFEPGAPVVCNGTLQGLSFGNVYLGNVWWCERTNSTDSTEYSTSTHLSVVTDLCPHRYWITSHVTEIALTGLPRCDATPTSTAAAILLLFLVIAHSLVMFYQ